MTNVLGSPDIGEESVDFRAQDFGLAAERAGGGKHFAGGRSGLRRSGADAGDVRGNLAAASRGLLNAARDLARRRALLFDRRCNSGGDLVDLADGLADVPDGAD